MTSPEKQAKDEVVAVLKAMNCTEHFAPRGGPYGAIGVADRIACLNGLYVAIECKAGANKLSPMQAHRLKSTGKNGGVAIAYWAGNTEALRDYLDGALDGFIAKGYQVVHESYVGSIEDCGKPKKFIKGG